MIDETVSRPYHVCTQPVHHREQNLRHRRTTSSWLRVALLWFLIVFQVDFACGHSGDRFLGGSEDPWWLAWHFDPLVVANLVCLSALYLRGHSQLKRRSKDWRRFAGVRLLSFALSLGAIAVALLSPLDRLGNELSWVHMTQHMVLMNLAAPLLALACPAMAIVWGLPRGLRLWLRSWSGVVGGAVRASRRMLGSAWMAWGIHAGVVLFWHLPWAYEAALRDPLIHDLEHLSFFLVAFWFWRIVLTWSPSMALQPFVAVGYLFSTSLWATAFGALMTLSPAVWYTTYEGRTSLWGLTALEDQQMAGAIMWMPACLIYVVVAAWCLWRGLALLESRGMRNPSGFKSRRAVTP